VRDYTRIAIEFAQAAVKDKDRTRNGELVRQASARFLDDLKRAKRRSCDFYFDEEQANNPCDFIEKLPHVEGVWDTPTIELHAAQMFFVVQLFGFRVRSTEWRRFTSALYATARKSGKSTLAAGILLYCQCCEDEPGAQIISAATTFPQAAIIFNVAKRMVEREPDIREHYGLQAWAKAISRYNMGSSFKPIHAKASSQDGLNPSHTGLDEIHAHKTSDLLNVLTSAAGARGNPLWLYTTTEGYINAGPWSELRQFAMQLLSGVFKDHADHFLAVIFAIDKDDKDFDEKCWVKANPLIEVNPHLASAIRKESIEAKAMPSKLAEFQIKRLNRPASVASGWIDLPKWQACGDLVDLDMLRRFPCWAGLDLASTADLTALRLVWRVEDKLYTWGRRWVPEAAVEQRTERGTIPYAGWVAAGFLEVTEGDVTDYNVIEAAIVDAFDRFAPRQIAYDRWNAMDLVNRLVDRDLPMIEFVQGPKSYHPAMQELERLYISGRLAHGGDPVLGWCAANIVARRDDNMNMAPNKKRSPEKIDDMTALLMALGVSLGPQTPEEPKFQMIIL